MKCVHEFKLGLRSLLVSVFIALVFVSPAISQSGSAVTSADNNLIRIAEAEGTGHSEQEALQSAFDNAVKQAVGLYIETKTTISTADESFVKEVATLSNGYIAWYDKTSLSNLRDGTKRVLITAEVARERLEQRMTDQRIWTRTEEAKSAPVSGRNLNAKIMSEIKRDADAAQLLLTWLSKSPTNADCFLGVDIADVTDQPMEVAKLPRVEGRNHAKPYEYWLRHKINYDPTPVIQFGAWLDRAMSHVKIGTRREFQYDCEAKLGSKYGSPRRPTMMDDFLPVVIETPRFVAFNEPRNSPEHPLRDVDKKTLIFFIVTSADWKPNGRVNLRIASWIFSDGLSKILQQNLPDLLRPKGASYSLAGYGIDSDGKVISQDTIPLYASEGVPLERSNENCLMYSPFLGIYRGPNRDDLHFSIPYKYVSRLGCTLDEMQRIQDVEASFLERLAGTAGGRESSELERVGNRPEKVPADFEAFMKNFDFNSSAKCLIRTHTSLAPNRRTERSGVTHAWATLLANEADGQIPLKGQTIQVYLQSGNNPAQRFGTFTTDSEGKISFTEPSARQLIKGTKLLFKYDGDDRYRDASSEMLIR
ncbi:hypothetical protein SH449x_003302 [Pirellulaceae bacterium SH449]